MTNLRTTSRPYPHTHTKAVPKLVMVSTANERPLDKTVEMTETRDPQDVAAELTIKLSQGPGISSRKLQSNGFIDLKQDPETQEILESYRRNHPELQDTWEHFIRDVYVLSPPADRWYNFDGVVNEDKAKPIIYLVNKHDLIYQLTYLITKSHKKARADYDQYSLGIASQSNDPERCGQETIRAEMEADGDNYVYRSISRAKCVQANAPEFFTPEHFNRTLGNDLEFQIDAISVAADLVIPKIRHTLCRLYGHVSGNQEEGYALEFVVVVNGEHPLKENAAKQLSNRLSKELDFKVSSVSHVTIGISTLVTSAVGRVAGVTLTPEQRLFVRLHREFIRVYGHPLLEEKTDGFSAVMAENEPAYLNEMIDELYGLYDQMYLLTHKGELTATEGAEAARIHRAVTRLVYDVEIAQTGPHFASGSRVGKYEIIEKRAQGGFGSIFLARDMDLDRVSIMKFITQDRAENANFAGELAATDSHSAQERAAGTARVLGRGFYADCLYMVQSFENGITLKDAWQQILQTSSLQKRVLMQLVAQRVYKINLHKKIAHRDIKPENIIVPADSNGKIALPPLPREVNVANPSNKLLRDTMPDYFESAAVETFQAETVVIDLGNAAEDRTKVRVVSRKSVLLTVCSVILGITFSATLGTAMYLTVDTSDFIIKTTHLWGYCIASLCVLLVALSYRNRKKKVIDGEPGEGPLQATLAYFCPHQHLWVTSLSDVYALGGMYYKMIAGDHFFNGQIRCLENMDASIALRMKDHGNLWKPRNYTLWPRYAVNRRIITQEEMETLRGIDGMAFSRLKEYSVIVSEPESPELIENGMPKTYLRYNEAFVSSPYRLRKLLVAETDWDNATIEKVLDRVIPPKVQERDEGCIMGALQYDLRERMTLKELVNELNMINCGADNSELTYKAPWLGAGRMKVLFNCRLTVWLGKSYLLVKKALRWWFVEHFKQGLLLTIAALATGAGAYIENNKQKLERQKILQLKKMLIEEGNSLEIDVCGLSVDEMYHWIKRYETSRREKKAAKAPARKTRSSRVETSDDTAKIAKAFSARKSDIQVRARGTVIKVLPDDAKGSKHQRFILRLPNKQTVLIAHNVDLAPRVKNLKIGDTVEFFGEYEWNEKGGVVHWTHRDPKMMHVGGWLKHKGKAYQ